MKRCCDERWQLATAILVSFLLLMAIYKIIGVW